MSALPTVLVIDDEVRSPVSAQHIVRSFDSGMVCSVH